MKKIDKNIYRDFKAHFVGMGRMTLKQFEQWIKGKWKAKRRKRDARTTNVPRKTKKST